MGGIGNKERTYVGKLERVLFISVNLPQFDRYSFFQLFKNKYEAPSRRGRIHTHLSN